ncbi:MAG TPA: glycoside hydrolase family 125 protein, partial [Gemmatimonadaceae bacterium]|nr:glycoside hydrolase family 125 protein [Gemmatimonadaceae bacterium]
DGAVATGVAMRRRGWRELLEATRTALRSLEQSTGSEEIDAIVNRNLLFAYFYAVGRALDDAHFYLVRSRAPWNGRGLTVRDWDALALTLPAIQLADAPLARELLLRACELHGYAPGRGVNYLDGTLFEPGFSLEGVASYAIATERYIRETGDDQIVEEPVIADTLYSSADDLAGRRNKSTPLYATEVSPSGDRVSYPYTLHANAVAAMALDVFQRTLDAETAKTVEDPNAVRAAILRQFSVDRDGKALLASAIDLNGGVSTTDDPVASALWLPLYEAFDRSESVFRRTVKLIPADRTSLVRQLARLVGPDASGVLSWLRTAPLDNGLAAEQLDDHGAAVANGGDATLAGLLAYTVWYAIHALGLRP